MRDIELYAQILGVQAPWNVDCVDFLKEDKEVRVTVSLSKAGYRCPVCGKPCNGYDVKRRRWRHLDTCQYSTFIEADVPRVGCKEHGVHSVGVSWAQVDGIQSRAVARGLARREMKPVQDIGVDETSARKGHSYLTIVHDKATGNVIHVGTGRDTETIDGFYREWKDHLWAVVVVRRT